MFNKTVLSVLTVCVLIVPQLEAGIISVTGDIQQIAAPPGSVLLDQLTSNRKMFLFEEQQGLALPGDVRVNISSAGTYGPAPLTPADILAGTPVNTYLVHSDTRRGRNQEYDGSVTFGNPVLGVITRTGRLEDTDSFLGAPGTIYSQRVNASGLELVDGQDWVELSADMLTVTMHLHTHGAVDEVRILESAVPEPGSFLLLGAGLMVLPLLRKRL